MRAWCLSGGGTRGDFEVGAVRYLDLAGRNPNSITGTSVGAVNGVKLAEGRQAILELEQIWANLSVNSDMYVEEPWFAKIESDVKTVLNLMANKSSGAFPILAHPFFPIVFLVENGVICARICKLAEDLSQLLSSDSPPRSLYNLSPIRELLETKLDHHKRQDSGISLRIAAAALESGRVRYLSGDGFFVDAGRGEQPVEIVDAVLASATMPGVFPPVFLNGENYVDGGIRELLPVSAAVDLGAKQIYVVSASRLDPALEPSEIGKWSVISILQRSLVDITLAEIGKGDVGDGSSAESFVLIEPTFNVHDSLQIDPGLISISMAYGYMRAFDMISVEGDSQSAARASSDEIIRGRLRCWDLEGLINGAYPPGQPILEATQARLLPELRETKFELRKKILLRQKMFGFRSLPPSLPSWRASKPDSWFQQWEPHSWDPFIRSPFGRWKVRSLEPEVPETTVPTHLPTGSDLFTFDAAFYLRYNPDLHAEFGADFDAASTHWVLLGIFEGRRGSRDFDPQFYLAHNYDLQIAFGPTNYAAALEHWIRRGLSAEGRRGSREFDVKFYLTHNGDLQQAFGPTGYAAAVEHWIRNGIAEGRRGSREFDVKFYLARYQDLSTAFGVDYVAAMDHWINYGRAEGRTGAS